jgi:hypothetical protein
VTIRSGGRRHPRRVRVSSRSRTSPRASPADG